MTFNSTSISLRIDVNTKQLCEELKEAISPNMVPTIFFNLSSKNNKKKLFSTVRLPIMRGNVML